MADEENVDTQDVDLSDEGDAKIDTPPASGGNGGLTTTYEVVAGTKAWFNEGNIISSCCIHLN
jgi:hypothetical protein